MTATGRGEPRWSVVIAYYNEAAFIGRTLQSLAAQTTPARLILVDNASSDGSEAVCREVMARAPEIEVRYLHEARPGQLHALETGSATVETEFVAFCDADTFYPPHYLARAETVLERPGTVAAMAVDLYGPMEAPHTRFRRIHLDLVPRLLKRQAHTGSFGQCLRTSAMRAAGGYSVARWPYVLFDHEFMHRLFRIGRARYHRDLWCMPAPRRVATSRTRWAIDERILYHVTPYALKDWFFYRFLARRFEKRRLSQLNLRTQDWHPTPS